MDAHAPLWWTDALSMSCLHPQVLSSFSSKHSFVPPLWLVYWMQYLSNLDVVIYCCHS